MGGQMFPQRGANRDIELGLLFERAAAKHPTNLLILDHDLDVAPELGRRATLPEVADLVDDLASRLWAAGVRPGGRVVIYRAGGFDITLLACATARIGGVAALLSPRLDGATVAQLLRRAGRPHLITDQARLTGELPASVVELTAGVLLTSGTHPRATPLRSLTGAPRVDPVTVPPDHPTLITHTARDAGIPNLVVHTGQCLRARFRQQAMVFRCVVRGRETVAIHESFVRSPLLAALAAALRRGFPVAVLADPSPARVAELFARLRPGIIQARPRSYRSWQGLAEDPRRPLANVTLFASTGDPMPPHTVRRLLHASRRGLPLWVQRYGPGETGPSVVGVLTRRHPVEAGARCVGMPLPGGTGVRVVGRDTTPPSRRNPGHIEIRGAGRAVPDPGDPGRDGTPVAGGWWRTGDVGYRTRWGCVHLLDREVDPIPGFGGPLTVEDTLLTRLSQLAEVVIVPGADGTAIPVVCTRDDRELDRRAWRAATAGLPPMADPVQLRLADLPRNAAVRSRRLELARRLPGADRAP